MSVRLKPAGEAPVDRIDTTTTTLAPGTLPGGTKVTQRMTTVRIDAWDPATRIVSFTNAKGEYRIFDKIPGSVLVQVGGVTKPLTLLTPLQRKHADIVVP